MNLRRKLVCLIAALGLSMLAVPAFADMVEEGDAMAKDTGPLKEATLVKKADNFVYMFDLSGSLGHEYMDSGQSKLTVAKDVMKNVNLHVPDLGYNAALLAFAPEYQFERCAPSEADYVLHSGMGYEVLKCPGVRIFVTGENVSPDFNISDYAIAFDPISFGDRYCRLPLFRLYHEAYACLTSPRPPAEKTLANKRGFCAYVMSNVRDSASERVQLFEALSRYRQVDSGGRWRNNVGGPVGDKITFQSGYKFVLTVENSSTPGYLTEKFAEAAQANAIPIYWGDPTVTETFNPRAFINCHEFDTFDAMVRRVAEIDSDDSRYLQMLSEPWFPDGVEPD
jgi:hypothetical protein